MTWTVFEIEPAARVVLGRAPPELEPGMECRVAAIWRAARADNPALFNGSVFSVDQLSSSLLTGHWTEYRRIVARLRYPELAGTLGVRPLAVAGLIEGPDGIVFGRRPSGAVYQPGLWQLAPAGNVDPFAEADGRIDLGTALRLELREELGLAADTLSVLNPFCMVEHPGVGVLDLCIAARTELSAAEIHRAHAAGGDGEYPELAIVPRSEIRRFLAARDGAIAPQVRRFLARYGVLGG